MQIVAPERDTPGTSASACAQPTSIASVSVIVASGRCVARRAAQRSIDRHHDADDDQRARAIT